MQKPALVILNIMDLKLEWSHIEYFQSLRLICLKLTAYVDICAVIFIAHIYIYVCIYIYASHFKFWVLIFWKWKDSNCCKKTKNNKPSTKNQQKNPTTKHKPQKTNKKNQKTPPPTHKKSGN